MLEINPVLAGKFDNLPYRTAAAASVAGGTTATNLQATDVSAIATSNPTSSSTAIDARRYTQWDRTATEVHTDGNMSFGDFIDMINPLQHIPVASSVYRAITGDTINPISRIAGDILYGGAFGVASALMGGAGAIGNSVMEASTGKDTTSYVVASLFGDDKATTATGSTGPAPTMVADASGALNSPAAQAAALTSSTVPVTTDSTTQTAFNDLNAPNVAKMLPLTRGKQMFGGVMAPTSATPPLGALPTVTPGASDLANATVALHQAAPAPRIGNTIYANRFNRPPVTATASTFTTNAPNGFTATLPAGAAVAQSTPVPASNANPLPQNLMDDLAMLKSLNKYNNTAANRNLGANVNITN